MLPVESEKQPSDRLPTLPIATGHGRQRDVQHVVYGLHANVVAKSGSVTDEVGRETLRS